MGTVNEIRIREIRNYLLKKVPDSHFSMDELARRDVKNRKLVINADHPACLASHVCYFHHHYPIFSILYSASILLGLSISDTYVLFLMAGAKDIDVSAVTPRDAANVLTRYLDTGIFTWDYIHQDRGS